MAIDDNASYELTGYQVKDLASKIRAKADSNSLASVATSGLYSDLTGAPTIPTVYNGTLTIQQNGTTLGTFSANQDTNETINITGSGGATVTTLYTSISNDGCIYRALPLTSQNALTGQQLLDLFNSSIIKVEDQSGYGDYYITKANTDITGYDVVFTMAYIGSYLFSNHAFYNMAFVNFSDDYFSEKEVDYEFLLRAGSNVAISRDDSTGSTTISATDTTYSNFTGATSSVAGSAGLVPAPSAGDESKVLKGDGTWQDGYDRVALYITNMPAGLTTPFYIYKDPSRQQPITWSEMRSLLSVSSGKEVVLWLNNSGDDIYHVVKYCDDTTEFYIVDPDVTAYYYIQNNSGDSTQTQFSIEPVDLQKKLTAGSNITITNGTISATDTTYSDFTGATASVAGAHGLVPAPAAGDEGKALHGDGTWKDTTAKLVEMSYGESNAWAKFIAAYNAGSIVYCRASSNANPGTGSQTRKAFMAYVNNATSPTNVEFQYVRSQSSKTDSQQCDQVFVYTLTNTSGGTWSVASRNMGPKIVAGTGMSSTFTTGANATITLNAEPNYSTSEVDTKVKWVDGKTIYRKTIHTGTLPNASSIQVAHGISYSSIVKVEGIAQGNSNLSYTSFSLPFSGSVSNPASFVQIWVDATEITISTGSDRSAYDSYVTLYYTKSS